MTVMLKVKARWSGLIGLPGYSIFYFRDFGAPEGWDPTVAQAQGSVDKVRVFFDALKTYFPTGCTIQVEGAVEKIEDTTGQLTGILGATAPAAVLGIASASAPYMAPVGAVVNWGTSTIRKGRRIRGRTFLVPLSSTVFENNGTPAPGLVTAILNAGTTLAADTATPDLGVYARPERLKDANGNDTGETLPNGQWAPVTAVTVPDLAAVLRSRRD